MLKSSILFNDSVADSDRPQHSGIYAHGAGEGLHRDTEDGAGDSQEEEPSQANARTSSKANSENNIEGRSRWEEKKVLSGL